MCAAAAIVFFLSCFLLHFTSKSLKQGNILSLKIIYFNSLCTVQIKQLPLIIFFMLKIYPDIFPSFLFATSKI